MKTERRVELTWSVPGCVVARARCSEAAQMPTRKGAPVDVVLNGVKTVVDVFTQDSTRSSWGVNESREGFPPVSGLLDRGGSCVNCGRDILRTSVTPEGEVLVGH